MKRRKFVSNSFSAISPRVFVSSGYGQVASGEVMSNQVSKLWSQLSDSYYRSILLKPGDLAAQRKWQDHHHQHMYYVRWGAGVFYYECVCGDGTGQILYPERKTAV